MANGAYLTDQLPPRFLSPYWKQVALGVVADPKGGAEALTPIRRAWLPVDDQTEDLITSPHPLVRLDFGVRPAALRGMR